MQSVPRSLLPSCPSDLTTKLVAAALGPRRRGQPQLAALDIVISEKLRPEDVLDQHRFIHLRRIRTRTTMTSPTKPNEL